MKIGVFKYSGCESSVHKHVLEKVAMLTKLKVNHFKKVDKGFIWFNFSRQARMSRPECSLTPEESCYFTYWVVNITYTKEFIIIFQ